MDMKTSGFVILAFLAVTPTKGYFDGLYEVFDTLRGYAEGVQPYLQQGLRTAIKAERFVDFAIGEECIYECPYKSQRPVPRKGQVKTANGCGSFDIIFDDSEASYLRVEKAFTGCCDEHDYCYDTCNSDKDECDLKFKKCLYKNCRNLPFLEAKKCKLKAKIFYLTVIGVGCQSYMDAQEKACDCIKRGKEEL